jgi:hypothetical protein
MRKPMTISSNVIGEVENLKYLDPFVYKERGFGMDVKHRIKGVWMK